MLIGVATFEEGGNQGVAFVLDLTERKRAEQAFGKANTSSVKSSKRYQAILWSTDPDGEPTHTQSAHFGLSRHQFEDFKHRGWEAYIHPDDYPETAKAFYHAIQTGTSYQDVMRLRRADGEFRWHQVVVSLCAINKDTSSSGMACLLTSMMPRRPKTSYAAAKLIWRKHRG